MTTSRPLVMGIVNVTADSFSDGGKYLATENALAQAWRLVEGGADIIDLGPAASHPGAQRVSAEEEIRRLADVMGELVSAKVPVSVDSFLPETQRFAAAHGATYLNDIQGFPDPERHAELADSGCTLIVMHSVQRRGPATEVRTDASTVTKALSTSSTNASPISGQPASTAWCSTQDSATSSAVLRNRPSRCSPTSAN